MLDFFTKSCFVFAKFNFPKVLNFREVWGCSKLKFAPKTKIYPSPTFDTTPTICVGCADKRHFIVFCAFVLSLGRLIMCVGTADADSRHKAEALRQRRSSYQRHIPLKHHLFPINKPHDGIIRKYPWVNFGSFHRAIPATTR